MESSQSPFSTMKSPVMRNMSQTQGSVSSPYLPGYLFGGSSPAPQATNNNNTPSYGHKMQNVTGPHLNNRTSMSNLGNSILFFIIPFYWILITGYR